MQNENCFTEKIKTAIVFAVIIIVLIGFGSCNVLKNTGQVSANKNSDWYKMNLKGKVKTASWNWKDDWRSEKNKFWFNEFGFVFKSEKFIQKKSIGKYGEVILEKDSIKGFAEYKFDNAGNLTSSISTEIDYRGRDTATIDIYNLEFNNQGNITKAKRISHEYSHDYRIHTYMWTHFYQYDNLNNKIYDSVIGSSFMDTTTIRVVRCGYDKKSRIVFEKEISGYTLYHSNPHYTNSMFSYKRNWQIRKVINGEYFNNKKDTTIKHRNNSRQIISKNRNGDIVKNVSVDTYKKQTEKIDYEYDEQNNWVQRRGERVIEKLNQKDIKKPSTTKTKFTGSCEIEYYK
ncbi:MAG: hypothetical protein RIQ33_787 [Bacteroidota bacterium]